MKIYYWVSIVLCVSSFSCGSIQYGYTNSFRLPMLNNKVILNTTSNRTGTNNSILLRTKYMNSNFNISIPKRRK
jgi:hypothetical protein